MKVLFKFLWLVISRNSGKLAFLLAGLISLLIALNIGNDHTETNTAMVEANVANRWIYVVDEGGDDPYHVKTFPDRQLLTNGQLTYPTFSPYKLVLFIVAAFFWIAFAVSHAEGDDHWEFRNYWCEAVSARVKLYQEDDGSFFYVLDGRLICKSPHKVDLDNMIRYVSKYLRSPNLFEKCASISEERERKISQLIS